MTPATSAGQRNAKNFTRDLLVGIKCDSPLTTVSGARICGISARGADGAGSGDDRRSVLENAATQKQRLSRAGVILRHDREKHRDKARERRCNQRILTPAADRCCEALMLLLVGIVMNPLVQLRRSGERQRQHEPREHRADERESKNSCMARRLQHGMRIARDE